jgi:hypothetical protein
LSLVIRYSLNSIRSLVASANYVESHLFIALLVSYSSQSCSAWKHYIQEYLLLREILPIGGPFPVDIQCSFLHSTVSCVVKACQGLA